MLKAVRNPFVANCSFRNSLFRWKTCKIRNFSIYTQNPEIKQFAETFPKIVNDFLDDPKYKKIKNILEDLIEYNVPTGKKFRSISLLRCYKNLEDPNKLTSKNLHLANILAWAMEMLQAATVIIDDIIDNSTIRRGQLSWHKKVGLRAIPDVIVLESCIYHLLKKHFNSHPRYLSIIDSCQDAIFRLSIAGILESKPKEYLKIRTDFTMGNYYNVIRYKTTSTAFELPYILARCLANKNPDLSKEVREIFTKFGEFYQIQNDFMDCYVNESLGSKTNNDIEEGKCTWLIVKALEKADEEERNLLEMNYGKNDSKSVEIIKSLYSDLGIPKEYDVYEKNMFEFIEKNIEIVSKLCCWELMFPKDLYKKYVKK